MAVLDRVRNPENSFSRCGLYHSRETHSVYAIICVYVTGKIDNWDWTETQKISDAFYVSYFELNYLSYHIWHAFTIVKLLLVAVEFFCLLRTLRE